MTIILAFVAAHFGVFLTGLLGAFVAVGTWFHGKSTGTAQAAKDVSVAKAETEVAQWNAADAQADAKQAKQEAAAVKVVAQAQADAASMSDSQLDAEAAKLGILPKE